MSELKAFEVTGKALFGRFYTKKVYDKDEADKVIAELKEAQRWRKFPEEKPEWGKDVLIIDKDGDLHIVHFSHDFKWISWGKMNTCESDCVTYWMPLPQKPEEYK